MAKKKSSAQIKRNLKRAEARGEVYVPPSAEDHDDDYDETTEQIDNNARRKNKSSDDTPKPTLDPAMVARREIALKLEVTLKELEEDNDLKAKDRRSEKRKAKALAAEEAGIPADELLEWFDGIKAAEKGTKTKDGKKMSNPSNDEQHKLNPYIAFVGQLSFKTTKEALYSHIQKALASEKLKVSPETLKIRLLTDPKTKKSRGMAFVEVYEPEILYALLKLHHTMLEDRRINVERSAGGGKEGKKAKIDQFRKDQQSFMENQVKQMLQEYIDRKELMEGELDETAILVCTRHSPVIVQAALNLYVEKGGRDMDNPSAFFTFLITKVAEEGVPEVKAPDNRREHFRSRSNNKRQREEPSSERKTDLLRKSSRFAQEGVDLSTSEPNGADLSSIFPSYKRGRGRGH
jgi:RNA recognition motif-containing protein